MTESIDQFLDEIAVGNKGVYVCGDSETEVTVTKLTRTQIVTTGGRFHRLRGRNFRRGDGTAGTTGYLKPLRKPVTP